MFTLGTDMQADVHNMLSYIIFKLVLIWSLTDATYYITFETNHHPTWELNPDNP
jgi:hypothetical protein